jgi:hypothetical protein
MTREFFTPEAHRWIAPSIYFASESMLRLNSLNCYKATVLPCGTRSLENRKPDPFSLTTNPRWAIGLVPSPIGSPEQSRGVLTALRDARLYW